MAERSIESLDNPRAKLWAALLESRGLRKHRRFLLAGRKTVREALDQHPERFESLLLPPGAEDLPAWPELERIRLGRALFDRLDVSGTGLPILVGVVPEMAAIDLARPPEGLELVCALGDPSNLGALLRSAAAFAVSRIILLADAAHPFHPKCLRAASNAQFALELRRGPAWAGLAQAAGPLLALDGQGDDLSGFAWPRDLRLVLGEEGLGLPPGLDLRRLAIPTTGAVESLNATVAASLALYGHYVAHGHAISPSPRGRG
ncbi:TrmH family RNA methyltransferase [Inquilinus ginsengisoli]|uniref:TrmH family RNA methyltransferase n=1 Tax=Inquilinus ginsengisoli TaxID=363840 RepID=UPI003D1EAE43